MNLNKLSSGKFFHLNLYILVYRFVEIQQGFLHFHLLWMLLQLEIQSLAPGLEGQLHHQILSKNTVVVICCIVLIFKIWYWWA